MEEKSGDLFGKMSPKNNYDPSEGPVNEEDLQGLFYRHFFLCKHKQMQF